MTKPQKTKQPTAWELAADGVLSVILSEPDKWIQARAERNLQPAHFPDVPRQRLYAALCDLAKESKPLEMSLIFDRTNSTVDPVYLAMVTNLYDTFQVEAFGANCDIVRNAGLQRGLQSLLEVSIEEARKGRPWREVTASLINVLSSLGTDTNIKGETGDALINELLAHFETLPPEPIATGVNWFDTQTLGLGYGKLWAIAAPYKSRKTTVMLNVALGIMMSAHFAGKPVPSVGIMSGEMLAHEIGYQMLAMLSVAWLHAHGYAGKTDDRGRAIDNVYGTLLERLGKRVYAMGVRTEAIRWAVDVWKRIIHKKLRIYDKRSERGGLTTFAALESCIKRDLYLYDSDVILIDYLQAFSTEQQRDDDHARVEYGGPMLQNVAKVNNIAVITLAQQNEAGISGSGNTYSPNVRGGGKLASAVDYLVTSLYQRGDLDNRPDAMRLEMKLGRFVGKSNGDVRIHPPSGLILDNAWMQHIKPRQIDLGD